MRGFIFSIVTISFMLLLMMLASAAANEYSEMERARAKPEPIVYAAAILDNTGKQFADTVLPRASFATRNDSLGITITDSVPRPDASNDLSSMKWFVENQLSAWVHAAISVNITNVTGGELELRMLDSYIYSNSQNGTHEVMFRPVLNQSGTGSARYNITLTVDDYRGTVSSFAWDPSGDINVTLTYNDRNGTETESGMLLSTATNDFSIKYGVDESMQLDLRVGRLEYKGDSWDGALFMNVSEGEPVGFLVYAGLPPPPANASNRIVFPIQMTYSQDGFYKSAYASR